MATFHAKHVSIMLPDDRNTMTVAGVTNVPLHIDVWPKDCMTMRRYTAIQKPGNPALLPLHFQNGKCMVLSSGFVGALRKIAALPVNRDHPMRVAVGRQGTHVTAVFADGTEIVGPLELDDSAAVEDVAPLWNVVGVDERMLRELASMCAEPVREDGTTDHQTTLAPGSMIMQAPDFSVRRSVGTTKKRGRGAPEHVSIFSPLAAAAVWLIRECMGPDAPLTWTLLKCGVVAVHVEHAGATLTVVLPPVLVVDAGGSPGAPDDAVPDDGSPGGAGDGASARSGKRAKQAGGAAAGAVKDEAAEEGDAEEEDDAAEEGGAEEDDAEEEEDGAGDSN